MKVVTEGKKEVVAIGRNVVLKNEKGYVCLDQFLEYMWNECDDVENQLAGK